MTARELNAAHGRFWSNVSYDSKANPVVRPDPPKIPQLHMHKHDFWMRSSPVNATSTTSKRR